MGHTVTLIRGDGIGPEVAEATKRVVDATGVKIDWDIQDAGVDVHAREGTPLPERVKESMKRTKVCLKAPITTPVGTGFRSVNVELRKIFDLYACLRPCKTFQGVRSRYDKIDLVIVRENTEDLYAGIEFKRDTPEAARILEVIKDLQPAAKIRDHAGISIKPISVEGSRRIVEFAFDFAEKNGRKKVTAVHKANIMKHTDGLFLEVAREVATKHPKIEFEDRIVDNMCMQLVQFPDKYDVLVLPNLYGDIVSDLCAGLIGGLGVAPGANIGLNGAMFEAVHGSAPKYAGQNKVNPTALILSGALMLDYLGEKAACARVQKACAAVIAEGKHVTYDLRSAGDARPPVGTKEMADAIIARL
ncbi:MAG: isocitrate/isopropylmalate dehydrogenase family protein [Planctomycetes bacterium]|nr:isocitrate/isopropylmalate dehydrogenase family protein [Planctomycetota bacterium]